MKIYSIGFTKKTAKEFFQILKDNQIEQLVDIRLNNTSQLAGFTKKKDLEYFLKEISNIDYYYFDYLAPTKELRTMVEDWPLYINEYLKLLEERKVLDRLNPELFQKRTVFLCSEPSADKCHRGILTDYLKEHWEDVEVIHL
ncbi:MAG: DUF488 domain-containing protein [Euryarchaeota archaeon]|jgi:uncharacterized protein (DUF488 family)|nr:DUF488 domain-containing protein [Euryarchaeota archaeon]